MLVCGPPRNFSDTIYRIVFSSLLHEYLASSKVPKRERITSWNREHVGMLFLVAFWHHAEYPPLESARIWQFFFGKCHFFHRTIYRMTFRRSPYSHDGFSVRKLLQVDISRCLDALLKNRDSELCLAILVVFWRFALCPFKMQMQLLQELEIIWVDRGDVHRHDAKWILDIVANSRGGLQRRLLKKENWSLFLQMQLASTRTRCTGDSEHLERKISTTELLLETSNAVRNQIMARDGENHTFMIFFLSVRKRPHSRQGRSE